jgi:uncharacterized protein YecE (DUF72 family)
MDFGKLEDISEVDFTLPPDNPFTEITLKNFGFAQFPTSRIYIGPPVWANKDWVGKIYPSNAKEKDFLYYYSRQFNTIELNVTHYQIPSEATILKWKEAVPENFKFCPKFPQIISHDKMLLGAESLTDEFCSNILGLGENLGTTFLQLSPTFEPKHLRNLEQFLKLLPENFPVAVEFRHQNWFKNTQIWQETSEILASLNVGTVITDVAGRRDVLHQTFTAPIFTLRFVGNELHETDFRRVDAWCSRLINWLENGLQTAYIFVHCGENKLAPELTRYWIRQLKTLTNADLIEPQIREKVVQVSLF